ncbi:MAG: aldo/keto reductase [Anaerolineales bacterium]|jgi:predicted aldo/keto reductase-like oxidoreductase
MITKVPFGRTGHRSSRIIFGAYALSDASQAEADRVFELLLSYGVNHIDTAPMYGKAELRIGPWMEKHRDDFFLATKSRSRTYKGAWTNLQHSLERLRVDYVDLWQMHGLTNPGGWEKAMGPGGALEAFLKARDKGMVRFLGVTGHGKKVPAMHLRSLERFDFDTVMLPYSYCQMQDHRYAADFEALIDVCCERDVAVQTIKSVARRSWGGHPKTYNTYFYEPLAAQAAIDKSVHWALGLPDSFLITAGDMQVLPKMLEAASNYEVRPSDDEMNALVEKFDIQLIFSPPKRRKGPKTWGYQMSLALGELIGEGFFTSPQKRSLEQVLKALESRGLPTEGKESNITNALAGRVKKGLLKTSKLSNGTVYWTE